MQLKSPPRNSEWVSMSGMAENSLIKNWLSSQLGTYRYTRVTGLLKSSPDTITNWPLLSVSTLQTTKGMFLYIRIADPQLLALNHEGYTWPTQLRRILGISELQRWVSWRNAIPTFKSERCKRTLLGRGGGCDNKREEQNIH